MEMRMPKVKKRKRQTKKVNKVSYLRNHRSLFIIGAMVAALVIALAVVYSYIIKNYTVTTV